MYSPVVVAGSNTHNMPTKQNKKTVVNHAFRGQREAFLVPAPRSGTGNQLYTITTDSGGNLTFSQVLCPMGLTSVVFSSPGFVAGTTGNVTGPPLRRLYNTAIDFQWYRVTRARFIFVGSVASTAVGHITLAAYTDPIDVSTSTFEAYVSGPSGKTFDLSNASNKELSVSVPVDSTWKKVSSVLAEPGNFYPFTASANTTFAPVSTVSDLCFGAVTANIAGAAPSTSVGTFHLEYDIEFKGPIDSYVNN